MALDKEKVVRLIGMMNEMTAIEIPPMDPIIKCFEIGMDQDTLNYLLRVGTAPHTKENLEDLFNTMRATDEISRDRQWNEFWGEIMEMSFMLPHEFDKSQYELASIFPGWIELSTSGERTEKRIGVMEAFMVFWDMLKAMNVSPYREQFDAEGLAVRDSGASRMQTLTSITPARKSKKRTIAVDEPLSSEQQVLTKGTAFEILERNKDHICVMNCICRNHREISTGTRSDAMPLKSCMPVGAIADQLIASGVADPVPYEKAIEMIEDFERKGCIHTTFHYAGLHDHEAMAICNCDKDSCLLYGSWQRGYVSKVQIKAFNKPEIVDASVCSGCNKCGQFCPTDAIYYDKETKQLVFNYENCVGCGQCVTQCAFGVQKMVPDERSVYVRSKAE